jgi:TolB-like protein/DNA-binding winged helix-turn-helix (wHTH) protein
VLLAGGKPVKIGATQLELLAYLVSRHADAEAPTRDEIVAHVWRDVTVGENSLPVALSALRKVVRDHGGDETLIQTLPGRRYRYIGEVAELPQGAPAGGICADARMAAAESAPAHGMARRRLTFPFVAGFGAVMLIAALLGGLAWLRSGPAEPQLSLVVLPFRNLSADTTQGFLADAVTDDLTTELARIPGSLVIARETANTFVGRDVAAIHRALHVRYLIEGGVEPRDAALRINARLVDAATGAEIWAQPFDVPRDRVTDARDLLVDRVMAALDFQLVRAASSRSLRDRPDNPGALDLFFQARSIMDQGDTLADYEAAQAKLEAAIARQPDFGDALAELGWLLVCKLTDTDDRDEDADEARATRVIESALRLSRLNARALSAHGRLLSIEGDYAGAIGEANAALALAPNSADAHLVLANAEFYQGHLDAAAPPLEASLRIDPEGPASRQLYFRLGNVKLLLGKFTEAISLLRLASSADVDPPAGGGIWGRLEKTRVDLIAAYQLSGNHPLAASLYADYATKWLHRTVWRVGAFAPRTLSALRGYQNFLQALQDAGMMPFADENVDDHVPESERPIEGGEFTATPRAIPHASVIDTAALAALSGGAAQLLIIDLGSGTSVIEGAAWADTVDRAAGNDTYVDLLARAFSARFPHAPIVIMADGTYGVTSYNAALHLGEWAHNPVYWYRGGEEAWVKAGHRGVYRRRD